MARTSAPNPFATLLAAGQGVQSIINTYQRAQGTKGKDSRDTAAHIKAQAATFNMEYRLERDKLLQKYAPENYGELVRKDSSMNLAINRNAAFEESDKVLKALMLNEGPIQTFLGTYGPGWESAIFAQHTDEFKRTTQIEVTNAEGGGGTIKFTSPTQPFNTIIRFVEDPITGKRTAHVPEPMALFGAFMIEFHNIMFYGQDESKLDQGDKVDVLKVGQLREQAVTHISNVQLMHQTLDGGGDPATKRGNIRKHSKAILQDTIGVYSTLQGVHSAINDGIFDVINKLGDGGFNKANPEHLINRQAARSGLVRSFATQRLALKTFHDHVMTNALILRDGFKNNTWNDLNDKVYTSELENLNTLETKMVSLIDKLGESDWREAAIKREVLTINVDKLRMTAEILMKEGAVRVTLAEATLLIPANVRAWSKVQMINLLMMSHMLKQNGPGVNALAYVDSLDLDSLFNKAQTTAHRQTVWQDLASTGDLSAPPASRISGLLRIKAQTALQKQLDPFYKEIEDIGLIQKEAQKTTASESDFTSAINGRVSNLAVSAFQLDAELSARGYDVMDTNNIPVLRNYKQLVERMFKIIETHTGMDHTTFTKWVDDRRTLAKAIGERAPAAAQNFQKSLESLIVMKGSGLLEVPTAEPPEPDKPLTVQGEQVVFEDATNQGYKEYEKFSLKKDATEQPPKSGQK